MEENFQTTSTLKWWKIFTSEIHIYLYGETVPKLLYEFWNFNIWDACKVHIAGFRKVGLCVWSPKAMDFLGKHSNAIKIYKLLEQRTPVYHFSEVCN